MTNYLEQIMLYKIMLYPTHASTIAGIKLTRLPYVQVLDSRDQQGNAWLSKTQACSLYNSICFKKY